MAPVPMISAMVTSSTSPIALITSSRVRRFMAFHPRSSCRNPPVVGSGERGCIASAARGKPRRVLVHDPEFNCREDCYGSTDDHMDRHRGGSLEAQYPGRDQRPQSYDEVKPLLPDCKCRKCRDRERRDNDTGDIGVLRGPSGVKPEHPGRNEQNSAKDQVRDVT